MGGGKSSSINKHLVLFVIFYSSKYGVELSCCPDCGVGGCWSVMCHFRAENDVVYMERFHHNHRDWKYDLSYCFTRENFEAEIQKLK